MNLFLDILSPINVLILFDDDRNIQAKHNFDVTLNEATRLGEELHQFLFENNIDYYDLNNIVVVNGPGSFTGVRTTVLMVNTINFIIRKNITELTYFDLFDNYPIVKTSSKRDCFVKMGKNEEISIYPNDMVFELFQKYSIQKFFGDISIFLDIKVETLPNYEKIIKNISFQNKKLSQAFYLKKPNIS